MAEIPFHITVVGYRMMDHKRNEDTTKEMEIKISTQ